MNHYVHLPTGLQATSHRHERTVGHSRASRKVAIPADLGSPEAIRGRLLAAGATLLSDITWIVQDRRVSTVMLTDAMKQQLGLIDPEPIEAGWRQYTLGRRYRGPLLHLSPRGEVYVEFIDGYGLGMDATMPLYTLEQLDAILVVHLGRREVAA